MVIHGEVGMIRMVSLVCGQWWLLWEDLGEGMVRRTRIDDGCMRISKKFGAGGSLLKREGIERRENLGGCWKTRRSRKRRDK